MNTIYLLDTNLFIEAKNTWYAFDIVPSFWPGLKRLSSNGTVRIIDRVYDEIKRKDDQLADWIKNDWPEGHESSRNPDIISAYTKVITHVNEQPQYTTIAKEDFATKADSWLIAHALAKNETIVTHEKLSPESRKRVKIPNVCKHFDIPYLNIHELMRNTNFCI